LVSNPPAVTTAADVHLVWTIDCESTQSSIDDVCLGDRSVAGFCEVIREADMTATLFVLPEEARQLSRRFRELHSAGFEVGLHYHPHEDGHGDHCGAFGAEQQRRMYSGAIDRFAQALGFRPTTFRTGSFSANDSTFPVTESLGFESCSHSCPGRNMTALRSNWVGAPHAVHYAHHANRLLAADPPAGGTRGLVEVPMTTDPDSMIWSGTHPQDLRVELFDAKNQRFMIEKMLRRERARLLNSGGGAGGGGGGVAAIVALTHNVFDYSDPADFRTQTMRQMIADMRHLAGRLEVNLAAATIGGTADAFRASAAAGRAADVGAPPTPTPTMPTRR
jgi:peptidoglycan/xylan/chitin deacetylase (PgdA/CDA1 family)